MRLKIMLFALALAAVPATAKQAKPKPAAKPAKLVCAVTGEPVGKVTAATPRSTYKGKTYYFCCAACKAPFDKNPAKYVKTK